MYDDDRDALAAEYVLGTLSADERDQAEAMIAIDPGFAEIVRQWERRLGELNVMVEAVEPPAEVWDRIQAGIGGVERQSAPPLESELPAMEEPAPQTAPEAPFVSMQEPEEPQDLDALAPPHGLDDDSVVAALASSLLPPEPESALAFEPSFAPPPPRIERSADVIVLARKARRWRGMTFVMGAIAALLAIFVGVSQFAPGLMPLGKQSPPVVVADRTAAPASRFVAVLQHEPTAPAFLLTVDPQNRTLTVRRVSATAEAGRSYELWLVSAKFPAPRSLGVVGADEFTARPIPANFDADTVRTASYAISLEPAGGSQTGAPSGPILFTGKLVESVAGTQPKS